MNKFSTSTLADTFSTRRMMRKIGGKYRHFRREKMRCDQIENPPLSVVIPLGFKDFWKLPHTVSHLRKNCHNIDEIIIVAENQKSIIEFCARQNLRFMDENTILPLDKNSLHYGRRNGWLFQQLIKLAANTYAENRAILVWDADTIMLQKICLFDNQNRQIFYYSDEYWGEYFEMMGKIFTPFVRPKVSFITHFMLFDKTVLQRFQDYLKKRFDDEWYRVIVKKCNTRNISCFSEYETYAYFYMHILKKNHALCYWSNQRLEADVDNIQQKIARYEKMRRTVSFHTE